MRSSSDWDRRSRPTPSSSASSSSSSSTASDDEEADLYARLNVSRGASPRDIKRAKRRLALRLNPDKLFPRHYSAAERQRLHDDFHDQVRRRRGHTHTHTHTWRAGRKKAIDSFLSSSLICSFAGCLVVSGCVLFRLNVSLRVAFFLCLCLLSRACCAVLYFEKKKES